MSDSNRLPDPQQFLAGGGDLGALIRGTDWTATPLGPPDTWPQSLRSALSICLHSAFPTAIYWGDELRLFYNDAWAPIPAERHPWALGRPGAEVWPDIWGVVGPQFQDVMTRGEGFSTFDQMLPMERNGRVQETYWNYSFTPIRGEDGAVVGVFNQGHEVTDRIFTERRNRFLLELSDRIRTLSDPQAIIAAAEEALGRHLGASRVGYGEVEESARYFTTERNWTDGTVPGREGTHDLAGFGPDVHSSLKAGIPLLIPDVAEDPRTNSPESLAAFDAIDTRAAITASLVKDGHMRAALYVHANSPRSWTERDADLVTEVADRTWAAVERTRADARLRVSEAEARAASERLQLALDAGAIVGTWVWDVPGDVFTADERFARSFDLDPELCRTGLPLDQVMESIHVDDRGRVSEAIAEVLGRGGDYRCEYRVRRHGGGWRWVEANGQVSFSADGAPLRFPGVLLDVTGRRETLEALRESEARLRAVFDAVPVGVVLAEAPSGRIIGGNAQVEEVFGHPVLPSEDVDSYADWVAHHADGRQVAPESYPLARALGGEEERPELEVLYQRRDGRQAWLRLIGAPIRDEIGAITGAVVACLDIDLERRTEEALRRLNETLEAQVAERTADRDRMWRLTTDMMVVARFDGIINAVNPAWTTLLGWSQSDLLGDNLVTFIHPDDIAPTEAELGKLAEGVTTFRFENRYRASDGSYRWISWIAVPDEGLVHAVGRDITVEKAHREELERTQEALRQSQKLESMGQLTGGVAHDFNNLLTPIIGALDLLQRRSVGGEREQRLVDGALASAERAKVLVQRLLAFARRQPLQAVAVDLRTLMANMIELVDSTSGPQVKVGLDVAPGLPPVKADPNQIEMAILNLAVNARDAMPGGGTLTVSAQAEQLGRGNPPGLSPGAYVRLSVADTGVGMDEATLKRAIEPFFSTKGVGRGTGLGLSMVHGLAAQLGGALTIKSKPGVGTVVELHLPTTSEQAEQQASESDLDGSAGAGTILLVDDEEIVRATTADMLADLGYIVVEADSAESALRLLDSGTRIDLLVTDHLMPGMTGTELIHELRGRRGDMPALLISGYAESDGVPTDFPRLTKPFRRAELAASLQDVAGPMNVREAEERVKGIEPSA